MQADPLHPHTLVRCFDSNVKQAALFFDYVIPFVPEFSPETHDFPGGFNVPDILPPGFGEEARRDLETIRMGLILTVAITSVANDLESKVDDERWKDLVTQFREPAQKHALEGFWSNGEAIARFCVRYDLRSTLVLLPPQSTSPVDVDSDEAIAAALSGMRLVDVTQCTWDQILEFRRDSKSMLAFRRLLQFFRAEYRGVETRRIQDDLQLRLAAYNDVVRGWRFDTLDSSVAMILNSNLVAASGIASLATALFGAPPEVILAASSGAAMEVGNLMLHLRRRAYGLARIRRDQPLSYLISAAELA